MRRGHTHSSRTLALAALLLAATSPAQAEEPPHCAWDPGTQKMTPVSNGNDLPVWSGPAGNQFAEMVATGETSVWNFLYHCPTDTYLVIETLEARWEPVAERFHGMLSAEQGYTIQQIRAEVEALGATTRQGKGDLGRCACDHLQSIGALR